MKTTFFLTIKPPVRFPSEGPFLLSAGDIPFHFRINSDTYARVYNGTNPDNPTEKVDQNFFVSFDDNPSATQGTSLVVFLDDSGAGPDDNRGDMAIRITISPVPETATSFMLCTGLFALVGISRKKFNAKENLASTQDAHRHRLFALPTWQSKSSHPLRGFFSWHIRVFYIHRAAHNYTRSDIIICPKG